MYLKDSPATLSYFAAGDTSKIIPLPAKNYYYSKIDYLASIFLWSVILGTSRVTVFAELKGEIHITLIYPVYILNNAQVYFKTNELHALKNYLSNSFLRPKQTPVSYIIFFLLIIQIVFNTSSIKKKDVEGKSF